MDNFRCNGCGQELEAKTQCVAAACNHLFCTGCAQAIIEGDQPCPICEGIISRSNVKLVTLLQSTAACQLSLCGQTPQTIMESALQGIKFYCEQKQLTAQYQQTVLNNKFTKMQNQCKSKLQQVHQGYEQAKRKYQEAVQQKNAIEQDNQEMQQKYTQKAMQARKLQEMFKALQQENEDLKRRLGGGGGRSMPGGMLGAAGAGQLSGRSGQRSPFGTGAGTQMITTVQQQKSIIEFSPTMPGSGALLGHGSATVGPQRPGTAGFGGNNMFASAGDSPGMHLQALQGNNQRRPGTAANMFGAAAAGGGNRLGPGIVGGTNGMRMGLPRSNMASPGNGMMSM